MPSSTEKERLVDDEKGRTEKKRKKKRCNVRFLSRRTTSQLMGHLDFLIGLSLDFLSSPLSAALSSSGSSFFHSAVNLSSFIVILLWLSGNNYFDTIPTAFLKWILNKWLKKIHLTLVPGISLFPSLFLLSMGWRWKRFIEMRWTEIEHESQTGEWMDEGNED